MRPAEITTFERLFLLSVVLAVALLFLGGGSSSFDVDQGLFAVAAVIGIAIPIGLAFWASRGRSNIARWLVAAFTVYGLARTGYEIGRALGLGEGLDLVDGLSVAAILVQMAAVAMLFRPAARAWFAGAPTAI